MGRIWLGSLLLAGLLVFGLWSAQSSNRTMLPIAQGLETAAEQVRAGAEAAGVAGVQDAKGRWEAGWHKTAALSDHAPMDEIDSLFAQLDSYRGNWDHYAACCDRIAQLIYAMAEVHSPAWWNVL